jgi:hypothetical protein
MDQLLLQRLDKLTEQLGVAVEVFRTMTSRLSSVVTPGETKNLSAGTPGETKSQTRRRGDSSWPNAVVDDGSSRSKVSIDAKTAESATTQPAPKGIDTRFVSVDREPRVTPPPKLIDTRFMALGQIPRLELDGNKPAPVLKPYVEPPRLKPEAIREGTQEEDLNRKAPSSRGVLNLPDAKSGTPGWNIKAPDVNVPDLQKKDSGKVFDPGMAQKSLLQSFGEFRQAMSMITKAVNRVIDSLKRFADKSRDYVELFSPGAVVMFDQAVRDFGASMGTFLIPVVVTATNTLRLLASTVLALSGPLKALFTDAGDLFYRTVVQIVNVLKPIVEILLAVSRVFLSLSGVMSSVFEPAMKAVAAVLEVLATWLTALASALAPLGPMLKVILLPLQMVGDALQAFGKVLSAVFSWLGSLFGTDLGSMIDSFAESLRKAFQGLVSALVQMTAKIALLFGARGFVAEMAQAFKPKPSADGLAAMTNVRFISHTEFGRQAMLSAANAMGGIDKQKSGDEWLADIAAKLEKMLNDPDESFWQQLKSTLTEVTYKTVAGAVVQAASDAVSYINGETASGVGSFSAPAAGVGTFRGR